MLATGLAQGSEQVRNQLGALRMAQNMQNQGLEAQNQAANNLAEIQNTVRTG